MLKLELIQSRS